MSTFIISDDNNDKPSINDKSILTLKPSKVPKPYQPRSKKEPEENPEESHRSQRIREFISEKCYLGPLNHVGFLELLKAFNIYSFGHQAPFAMPQPVFRELMIQICSEMKLYRNKTSKGMQYVGISLDPNQKYKKKPKSVSEKVLEQNQLRARSQAHQNYEKKRHLILHQVEQRQEFQRSCFDHLDNTNLPRSIPVQSNLLDKLRQSGCRVVQYVWEPTDYDDNNLEMTSPTSRKLNKTATLTRMLENYKGFHEDIEKIQLDVRKKSIEDLEAKLKAGTLDQFGQERLKLLRIAPIQLLEDYSTKEQKEAHEKYNDMISKSDVMAIPSNIWNPPSSEYTTTTATTAPRQDVHMVEKTQENHQCLPPPCQLTLRRRELLQKSKDTNNTLDIKPVIVPLLPPSIRPSKLKATPGAPCLPLRVPPLPRLPSPRVNDANEPLTKLIPTAGTYHTNSTRFQ